MEFMKPIEHELLFPFMECAALLPRPRLVLEWTDRTRILAVFDTASETQNELDEDDIGYEEYFMCVMETIEILAIGTAPVWDFQVGGLFEINYHNFPDIVRDTAGQILLEKRKLLAGQ